MKRICTVSCAEWLQQTSPLDKSQEAAGAQHTAPLPLSSWPACWNGTCPFITGEIRTEAEEGRASAGLLWLCQLVGNETTGVEAGGRQV